MFKKDSRLTVVTIVQQLKDEYWQSPDYKPMLKHARDGDCRPLLEQIVQNLEDNNIKVSDAYIIKHDNDMISTFDSEKKEEIIEKKTEHVHVLLKFEKGATIPRIAQAVKVESQYIEKMKSGRYGYPNMLAYLIHAKDEDKHQYDPKEVVTVRGEDYSDIYKQNIKSWIKGRQYKKDKQESGLSVEWLIEKILAGEVTKNHILLTDEYYMIYGQCRRKINDALDTAGERKSYRTIQAMENGEFKKTVIFVNAESGAGKTLFSKQLINVLQRVALKFGQTWEFCVTASTNAFDEYSGQDILFLDDIKGYSLTVSDWLKLLDPYMISPISARYHNKMGSAKVIIITNTKDPMDFFGCAKGNLGEDLGQFVRRTDYLLEIKDDYLLSSPEKREAPEDKKDYPWGSYFLPYHSFFFSNTKHYTKNQAMDKLVKTIIRNMQWNKKN